MRLVWALFLVWIVFGASDAAEARKLRADAAATCMLLIDGKDWRDFTFQLVEVGQTVALSVANCNLSKPYIWTARNIPSDTPVDFEIGRGDQISWRFPSRGFREFRINGFHLGGLGAEQRPVTSYVLRTENCRLASPSVGATGCEIDFTDFINPDESDPEFLGNHLVSRILFRGRIEHESGVSYPSNPDNFTDLFSIDEQGVSNRVQDFGRLFNNIAMAPRIPGKWTMRLKAFNASYGYSLIAYGPEGIEVAKDFTVLSDDVPLATFNFPTIAQVIENPDRDSNGVVDLVEGKSLAVLTSVVLSNGGSVEGKVFHLSLTLPGQIEAIHSQAVSDLSGRLTFLFSAAQMTGVQGDPGEAKFIFSSPPDFVGTNEFRRAVHVRHMGGVKVGAYNGLSGEPGQRLMGRFSGLLDDFLNHLLPVSERADSVVVSQTGAFSPFLPDRFGAKKHLHQLALWDNLKRPYDSCLSENVVAVMPKEYFEQYWPNLVATPPTGGFGAFFVQEGPWANGGYEINAAEKMTAAASWAIGKGMGLNEDSAESAPYTGYLTSPSEYWGALERNQSRFDAHIALDSLSSAFFGTPKDLWISSSHYNQLLNRNFLPPTTLGIGARDVLRVGLNIAREAVSWGVAVKSASCFRRLRYEAGNLLIRIKGPQGAPLDEQRLNVKDDDFHLSGSTDQEVPVLVDLPYFSEASRVEVIRDGVPIYEESAQVMELEGALDYTAPDSFVGNAETGREELRRLIALMGAKLKTADFTGAIQVLNRELRPAVRSFLKTKTKGHDLEFVLADWNGLLTDVSLRLILLRDKAEVSPGEMLKLTTDRPRYVVGDKAQILGEARSFPESKEHEYRLKLEMDGKRIKTLMSSDGKFRATSFRLSRGVHSIRGQLQVQNRREASGLEAAEDSIRKEIFEIENQIRRETDPELIEGLEKRKKSLELQVEKIVLELEKMRTPVGNLVTKSIEAE